MELIDGITTKGNDIFEEAVNYQKKFDKSG
jgi:hypothetical protein